MPVQSTNQLPEITRFLAGLVTNRNPIDTPFSIVGLNVVQHYDALLDGLNMEISNNQTITRRPGFNSFQTFSGTPRDFFQYKDLNGAVSLWFDIGGELFQGSSLASSVTSSSLWSLVPEGNFLYAANGKTALRFDNTTLGTQSFPWGIAPPSTPAALGVNAQPSFIGLSDFIPATDTISGVFVITDANNDRILSVTINVGTVHVNITYSGNPITPNQSFTQVTNETVSGTAPAPVITTDVVTQTNGFTGTVTGTGITNGVVNWYPNTGVSTLDMDVSFTGNMTLPALAALLNGLSYSITATSIPFTAVVLLASLGFSIEMVDGMVNSTLASPYLDTLAVAMQIFPSANLGNHAILDLQYNSGLFDVTTPTYPLRIAPGGVTRNFTYTGPLVNITDTFTGTMTLEVQNGASLTSFPLTFTHATLQQMANAINGAVGDPVNVVQLGTTGYLTFGTPPLINYARGFPGTDITLTISAINITDDADTNLQFQFTPTICNGFSVAPKTGYQWAYGIRDIVTGHISNMSPLATLGPLKFPSAVSLLIGINQVTANQRVEIYRTADGGTTLLFLGYATFNGTFYAFTDSYTDNFLNAQIIGPIAEANDPPPVGLFGVVDHQQRKWGIVGNRVYFSGGPDTVNGSGNEAWPPANNIQFPGTVVALVSTSSGLAVFLKDDIHMIRGVDTTSFFPSLWLAGFGISNALATTYDGQTLYVYTTKQQLHALSPSAQTEIGYTVGDILQAIFPATTTNLTLHRGSSLDFGLYVSNGTNTILRYAPQGKLWSPQSKPLMGAGRVKSLETTTAVTTLLLGGGNNVFQRVLTSFADNGSAYSAFATVGVIQVASPGTVASIEHVAMQTMAQGTLPTVFMLNNEISGTFTQIGVQGPINDPPDLIPSQTLPANRWYLKSSLTPLPQWLNTTQLKLVFATEAFKNEVLSIHFRAKA